MLENTSVKKLQHKQQNGKSIQTPKKQLIISRGRKFTFYHKPLKDNK